MTVAPEQTFIMEHTNQRPTLYQPFQPYVLAVQVTPTPLLSVQNKTELINSFVLSLYSTAANNVFMGDGAVTTTTGIEIIRGGGPLRLTVVDERMKYEVMFPLLKIASTLQCQDISQYDIPITVWDLSQIYLVATAITNVTVLPFRIQFL